jgi:hypothetical protein
MKAASLMPLPFQVRDRVGYLGRVLDHSIGLSHHRFPWQ